LILSFIAVCLAAIDTTECCKETNVNSSDLLD